MHLLEVHKEGIRPRLELRFLRGGGKVIARVTKNLKQELAHCLSDEAAQLVYGRYGHDHEAYVGLTETELLAAIRETVKKDGTDLPFQL